MAETRSQPVLAILIVNFNRAADTLECLDSLLRVNEPPFHIFLADNGSRSEDVTILSEYAIRHPVWITFVAHPENYGFTGAHNRLFEEIVPSGYYEYILLLNNDAVVEPDFLTRMLARIDRNQRIEMVAARMMKYDNPAQVDNLGITFYKSGLASNRKSLEDPLLGPCGGCALYTADLLRQIYQATGEYFDPEFFCYAEDTDLAWRAVLLGYRAAYAEDALIYHKGSVASGGPNSDFVLYHGIRNSLWVLVKNVPTCLILPNLGWILLMHLAIPLRHMVKGKGAVVLRLYRDFFRGVPLMWRKRRSLHNQRLKSSANLQQLIGESFYETGYMRQALRELWGRSTVAPNVRV